MKILLDTHAIIWVLTDDRNLSKKAREAIANPANVIYYSLASIWEIAIKNAKSPDKCPYNEKEIADLCDKSGFLSLDITLNHIQGLRDLRVKSGKELSNHDPFDRILMDPDRNGDEDYLYCESEKDNGKTVIRNKLPAPFHKIPERYADIINNLVKHQKNGPFSVSITSQLSKLSDGPVTLYFS